MGKVTSNKVGVLLLGMLFIANIINTIAQDFTASDYNKALWMTTRFYGAQRSSDADVLDRVNWTVYDHKPTGVDESKRGISFAQDSDAGYDLSGGWFDCGDHVKFGQTNFYAGYMLLKSFAEFPTGYADYYSADYNGYGAAGSWTWESGAGKPNGIPDILDEVKHATDFYIKCAKSSSAFYYEVGNGNYDHAKWQTSVKMQTNSVSEGGEPRPTYGNPNDGAMASFCSATLALMSRMYRPYDAAYADLCLQHATYAYDYASNHVGQAVGAASGSFYGGNDNPKNAWAICLSEMHWATNQNSYLTKAYSLGVSANNAGDVHPNAGYTFDYGNNGELALYVLAQLGHPNAKAAFNSRMTDHWLVNSNYNGEGAYSKGGGWGKLRYVGNAGYLVALHSKLNDTPLNSKVYDNVDYIMGGNNAKFSFIVGFGTSYPKYPHHRNVYLRDDNPGNNTVIPMASKNVQLGALVGGSLSSGNYNDERNDYVNSEVCIDYNAGLVGALAAIKAVVDPVDPNTSLKKCASPGDLGGDQSLCGVGNIVLNSGLNTKNQRTFQWYKDDVSQGAASANAISKSITSPGTWKVVVDSAGECQRSATVVISGTLPDIDLGNDLDLCSPAQVTLNAGVSGSGISYDWKKGSTNVGSDQSLNVTEAGTYSLTISATGCPSKTDELVVTSSLPEVNSSPLCAPGTTTLNVTSAGGPYEWYTSEGSSTPLFTGNPYTPSITATTTYYLKDAGSFEQVVGPSQTGNALSSPSNAGAIGIKFTASASFDVVELKFHPYVYNCNTGDMIQLTVELQNENGTAISTHTSVPLACNGTQQGPFTTYYKMDFSNDPIKIPASGNYILKPTDGNQYAWYENGANYSSYEIPGVINITGDTRDDKPSSFPGIFDIKVSSGTDCDRTPVVAIVDPNDPNCVGSCTPPSVATITPSTPQVICSGNSVELSANLVSGSLYQWFRNGSPLTTAAINDNKLTVDQAGSYTVRIGDGSVADQACYLESSAVTVTVNTAPTANITTTNLSYCSSENGVTLIAEDAGTGATYSWSGPVTGSTATLANATAGTYYVEVTKGGCTATSSSKIVVATPAPTANITTTNLSYCSGENGISLTAENVGTGAAYTWTGPVTGSTVTLSNATAGTYTVKVTKGGCIATSSSKEVIEKTSPVAKINATALEYCSDDISGVTLTAESVSGATYSWAGPVTSTTETLNNATAGTYVLTVTKEGCSSTSPSELVVENCQTSCTPPANAIITASTQTACEGEAIVLEANLEAGYIYAWYKNGSLISGSTAIEGNELVVTTSGDYSVRIGDGSIADQNCYMASSATTINFKPKPVATIVDTDFTYCSGETGVDLMAENAGGSANYTWSGPMMSTDQTLTNATAGTYFVTVTDNGCEAVSSNVTVVEKALPTASISSTVLEYCATSQTGITLTAFDAGIGATYNWTGPVTGSTQTLSNATQGEYSVTVTKDGCEATSATKAVIENCQTTCTPPTAATISPLSVSLCEGNTSMLTANLETGYTYAWYRNNSLISGSIAIEGNELLVSEAGSYSLRIGDGGVTDANCYLESSPVVVEIVSLPVAKITTSALEYCSTNENGLTITAENAGTGATYTWEGPVSGNGLSISNATAGQYSVQVTKSGCEATSQTVTIIENCQSSCTPPMNAMITSTKTVFCSTGNNTLSSNLEQGYLYAWYKDGELISGSTQVEGNTLNVTAAGNYKVRIGDGSVLNTNCYLESQEFEVTLQDPPSQTEYPQISGNDEVCAGSDLTYTVNLISGSTQMVWECVSGCGSLSLKQNSTSVEVSNFTNDFVIQAYGENECGVSQSASYDVSVVDEIQPEVIISTPVTTVCVDGDVRFNATINHAGINPQIKWYREGVEVEGASFTSYFVESVVDGEQVYASVLSSSSCSQNTPVSSNLVELATFDPQPIESIVGPSSFCIERGSLAEYSVETQNVGSTFSWSIPNGAELISGNGTNQVEIDFTGTTGGLVTVSEISAGGCFVGRITRDVRDNCLNGISDSDLFNQQFSLFPNPSVEDFRLELPNSFNGIVKIVDLNGVLISENKVNNQSVLKFGNELQQGVYILQIIQENKFYTHQITKLD